MKKIISAALAASTLLALFAACGDEGASSVATDNVSQTAEAAETEPAESLNGRESAKDNVPALDFAGETVRIIYRAGDYLEHWDVVGTDNSGDLIWDAVWERNSAVQERLNVNFKYIPTADGAADATGKEIKSSVMSGSDDFDIIMATCNTTISFSIYPYLYELSDLKYVDIGQPWWRGDAVKTVSFDGKHYRYLFGDIQLNDYLKCGIMLFNKNIYNDYFGNPEEPYSYVLDGTWTWDRVMDMSKKTYSDLNGDGIVNAGDRFGLIWTGIDGLTHIVMSCAPDLYTQDEGYVDISPIASERNSTIIDKMIQVFHGTDGVWKSDIDIDNAYTYFAQDQSLLYVGRFSNIPADEMRNMESDYGILTLPKLNEEQSDYHTSIQGSCSCTCVPKTVSDARIDAVDAAIECLCAEAYRRVMTPFIETAMKQKYARDTLSGQVIDIVFDTASINFMELFRADSNDIFFSLFIDQITSGKQNFASSAEKKLASAQKALNKYVEKQLSDEG